MIHYARSLLLLSLAALSAWLGFWQLERMHSKQELIEQFQNAPEMELSRAIEEDNSYSRVRLSGQYDPAWQFFIDNKILDGKVGVHVLSLFQTDYSDPVLVNRGWLPVPADRRSLPEAPVPKGQVVITGLFARPNEDGIRLGETPAIKASSQPILLTYLDMSAIAAAVDPGLLPQVILLDPDDDTGFFGREWQPAVILPPQHKAYAVQWFALALAITIVWITLSYRSARKKGIAHKDHNPPDKMADK